MGLSKYEKRYHEVVTQAMKEAEEGKIEGYERNLGPKVDTIVKYSETGIETIEIPHTFG